MKRLAFMAVWLACLLNAAAQMQHDITGLAVFSVYTPGFVDSGATNNNPPPATSASYYERSTNDLTYAADLKNWYYFSAQFTNATAKTVDKVGFRCLQIGTGGAVDFTAKIFADNAGKPGTLLGTFETRNASTAPSGSFGWWYFTGTGVALAANTPYHVALNLSAYQHADNYVRWLSFYDTSGPLGWHSDEGITWPSQETFNAQPCIDVWGY